MTDNTPDNSDIAARIVRDATITIAEQSGDYALADRLKAEKLRDLAQQKPEVDPVEREKAITALRLESDEAASRGDWLTAQRCKARWLELIEL